MGELATWMHVAAGFSALTLFWIPIVTKKGGRVHRQAGWLYVAAMGLVALTALYLAIARIAFDPGASAMQINFSYFLIFVAVLSTATAWHGMRVLRYKTRTEPHRHPVDLLVSLLLVVSGLAVSVLGFLSQFPLLAYFPWIGVVLGVVQLRYWLNRPARRMHWIYEHMRGLLSCSIATLTAFAVFGAPRLLDISATSLVLWLAPAAVIVPINVAYERLYQRKYPERPTTSGRSGRKPGPKSDERSGSPGSGGPRTTNKRPKGPNGR